MSLPEPSFLVYLLELVDELLLTCPATTLPRPPGRGRPLVYSDALFYKALVIMVVRRLTTVHEFYNVLHESTKEMASLRVLLCCEGQLPCRRTWERRLKALPATLPAQIHLLGTLLLERLDPFATTGRAVAVDSTLLKAYGAFQWHAQDKAIGLVRHPGIDTQAGWTKSGHHGWVYGWKLHVVATCGEVWIPLAARLTPANTGDGALALELLPEVSPQVRFVLGDTHYNTPQVKAECFLRGQTLVASQQKRSRRLPDPNNARLVRSVFHKLRSVTSENFNQQFKALFDLHRPVPTKGQTKTQLWGLGALFTYQLLLLARFQQNKPLRQGLKYALHAA